MCDIVGRQKRQKYVKRCKDVAWRRWQKEYITELLERCNVKRETKQRPEMKVGDMVMIYNNYRTNADNERNATKS